MSVSLHLPHGLKMVPAHRRMKDLAILFLQMVKNECYYEMRLKN